MHSRLLFLGLVVLLCQLCAAAGQDAQPRFETNYEAGAVLSSNELANVVELARRCGVSNIAKIYVYRIPPTSELGVGVDSVEITNGRTVSFVNVSISRSSREPRISSSASGLILKSYGKFWVPRGGVSTNTLTTFAFRGRLIRARLERGLAVSTADELIGALVAGKIRYSDYQVRHQLSGLDLSQPTELAHSAAAGKFILSYGSAYSVFSVDCSFEDGWIVMKHVKVVTA